METVLGECDDGRPVLAKQHSLINAASECRSWPGAARHRHPRNEAAEHLDDAHEQRARALAQPIVDEIARSKQVDHGRTLGRAAAGPMCSAGLCGANERVRSLSCGPGPS